MEQPVLTAATEEEEAVTVTDEETGALTPEGNLTLVDDYHTDYSDGSGQQFITLVSKSGKAEKKVNQPTHCLLENAGLNMPSVVQAEQIFTIDKSRALKYLGHLTPEEMRRVDDAVRISLALNPMGSIQQIEPIRRSTALYAPPEVVDGKPPVYPYTPIRSSFENAGSIEEMMLYTELQSAVHAMIQRLEYSFTFNPSLLTSPKRKQQVAEILEEAEKYIWRIKEEMRCA